MLRVWLTAALLMCAWQAASAAEAQFVTVADPFIELHTGPGSGYPITQIIERGARIEILKRRTQWFKVRDARGESGWASREQMARTLQPSGKPAEFTEPGRADYQSQRWSAGLLAGDFGGATVYTGFGAYRLSRHLSLELNASQILGNFSDGWAAGVNISHTFLPEWRASPFFSLGTGIIRIEPKSTLAQAEDRSDQTAIVGAGVQAYLTRRFVLRAEYKSYVVLSSRNDNEDVDEWKAGFAVFF
jgi:hypothetical protein